MFFFYFHQACTLLGATVASAQFLPVSQTNANVGNIPVGFGRPLPPGAVGPGLDYFAHPRYNYQYHVADPISGDFKHHKEKRDGLNVRGEYGLVEPSGSIRLVRYVADDLGFRANVHRSPGAHVPGPLPVHGPVPALIRG
ncbi:unnamed protein product [Allacma fusca]|uniref:Cuticle protein n=1 Tax=Allacma fusca TaxID=39272 RepID=A0A8J2P5K1_9HEXA|nr:unnamed protein product [Allacma fusca]